VYNLDDDGFPTTLKFSAQASAADLRSTGYKSFTVGAASGQDAVMDAGKMYALVFTQGSYQSANTSAYKLIQQYGSGTINVFSSAGNVGVSSIITTGRLASESDLPTTLASKSWGTTLGYATQTWCS
jgi:hypothetical protein